MPRSSSKVPLDPTDPLVQSKLAERRAKDAAAKRAYRQAHPEEMRAKDRARYHKDPVKTSLRQKTNRERRKDKQKAYMAAYVLKNKARIQAVAKARYADKGEELRAKQRLYAKANPAKVNALNRRWRAANPEKQRAAIQQWTARHPDAPRAATRRHHARKRGAAIADVSRAQEQEILAVYGRCMYCPDDCAACLERTHVLELDHITAVSKGGNDTAQNLIPACRSCNARKNAGEPLRPVQPLLLTVAPTKKKRSA